MNNPNQINLSELTEKQSSILVFLMEFLEKNSYQPSLTEIAKRIRSTTFTVVKNLDDLHKARILGKRVGNRAIKIPLKTLDWWKSRSNGKP